MMVDSAEFKKILDSTGMGYKRVYGACDTLIDNYAAMAQRAGRDAIPVFRLHGAEGNMDIMFMHPITALELEKDESVVTTLVFPLLNAISV